MGKPLGHREGGPDKQSTLEHFDRIVLQRSEHPDDREYDDHDNGQRGDHDRLNRKGERIDQFLNGQRDDQREEPNCEGIGDDESQNSTFEEEENAKMFQDLIQVRMDVGWGCSHMTYWLQEPV